jgi:hypothetical protein
MNPFPLNGHPSSVRALGLRGFCNTLAKRGGHAPLRRLVAKHLSPVPYADNSMVQQRQETVKALQNGMPRRPAQVLSAR